MSKPGTQPNTLGPPFTQGRELIGKQYRKKDPKDKNSPMELVDDPKFPTVNGMFGTDADIYVNAATIDGLSIQGWGGLAGEIKVRLTDSKDLGVLEKDWKHKSKAKLTGIGGTANVVTGNDNKPIALNFGTKKEGKEHKAFLVHAGSPIYNESAKDKNAEDQRCFDLLKKAYIAALEEGRKIELLDGKQHTLAIAPLGIGIYGNPIELSAKAAFEAIQEYKEKHKDSKLQVKITTAIPEFVNKYRALEKEDLKQGPSKSSTPPPQGNHEPNTQDKPTVDPEEVFSTSPPHVTPHLAHTQHSNPPLTQEPLVGIPQTSLKEVHQFLEKNKAALGIHAVTAHGETTLSVQLKDQGVDSKPLNYYVNETSQGAAFSIKAGLQDTDASKVIQRVCQGAIALATPGKEITLAENAPNKEFVHQVLQHYIQQGIKDKKFTAEDAPKIKTPEPQKAPKAS